MALGSVRLFARKHLLPQWKVLACEDGTIFGIILSEHYLRRTAERRAAKLNSQLPGPHLYTGGAKMTLYFKPQKNTCF